ncbi:hypothetical protein Sjap_015837 [Stephania japonica]|uniref:Uncharacterized protein n=1 Tax=Stephania japonica TaxID=461633 RepID=A0AAP0NT70_9MAGN
MEAKEREEEKEEESKTSRNEIWCWGAGTDGQLGLANHQDQHLPQPLPSLPPIAQLSCGGAHVLALTKPPNAQLLTWGRPTNPPTPPPSPPFFLPPPPPPSPSPTSPPAGTTPPSSPTPAPSSLAATPPSANWATETSNHALAHF